MRFSSYSTVVVPVKTVVAALSDMLRTRGTSGLRSAYNTHGDRRVEYTTCCEVVKMIIRRVVSL